MMEENTGRKIKKKIYIVSCALIVMSSVLIHWAVALLGKFIFLQEIIVYT